MIRAALLGSGGMLAHALAATVPTDVELFSFTHADLDVTTPGAVRRMFREYRPNITINAAAYTDVDGAEVNPTVADRVNAAAPRTLAELAAEHHCRLVHFSSDYVFDGTATEPYTEESTARPINRYGAGKLEGERAVLGSGADALVVRAQWLFGAHGRNFPGTILSKLTSGTPVRVVSDQFGCPTYTMDLAPAVWKCARMALRGCIHIANEGVASWFDVALALAAMVDRQSLVTPCTAADFGRPAPRPAYSVLSTLRLKALTGVRLRHWLPALRDFADIWIAQNPPRSSVPS